MCSASPTCQRQIAAAIADRGWAVEATNSTSAAIAVLDSREVEVLVVTLDLPRADRYTLLGAVGTRDPRPDVLAVCDYAGIEEAVSLMEHGAADYLLAPLRAEELDLKLQRLVRLRDDRAELRRLRSILAHHRGADSARPFTLHLEAGDTVRLPELLRWFEEEVVAWALRRCGGERTDAARLLGVPVASVELRRPGRT